MKHLEFWLLAHFPRPLVVVLFTIGAVIGSALLIAALAVLVVLLSRYNPLLLTVSCMLGFAMAELYKWFDRRIAHRKQKEDSRDGLDDSRM